MSSPQLPAADVIEPTVAPVAQAESAPTAEAEASAAADQPTEAALPAADLPTPVAAETEAAVPAAVESPAADEPKGELTKSEEKKEKKQGRKPFAELLNKILKPQQEKSNPEKKGDVEATEAPAEVAAEVNPEAVAQVTEAAAAEPEVVADVPEATEVADAPATAQAEDATKDITTPRKERGNIFEKFTAFVMKPKSPKGKKSEAVKEEVDEVAAEATPTEAPAPLQAQPAEQEAVPALASPQMPVPEVVETPAVEANPEATAEAKVEKKEKTPKDLAKLARRFSGRLFGIGKDKDVSKKPEPTQEEIEAAAQTETPAEVAADAIAEPQIPVATTPEAAQAAAEPTPVIAAAA